MAHIHEKIDFTATAYIVCGKKVLLRMHDKYHIWTGVGGHIELDEDANQALLREVKEEVGLDVEFLPPPHLKRTPVSFPGFRELVPPNYMDIHAISETHQHHNLVYFVRAHTDTVVPENQNDQWKWLAKEEIESKSVEMIDEVQHYCLEALRRAEQP